MVSLQFSSTQLFAVKIHVETLPSCSEVKNCSCTAVPFKGTLLASLEMKRCWMIHSNTRKERGMLIYVPEERFTLHPWVMFPPFSNCCGQGETTG